MKDSVEPDWEKIRFAFCETDIPAIHICSQFDIGASRLRTRAQKEGWQRPQPVRRGPPRKKEMVSTDTQRFESAQDYLEAVVAGLVPPCPLRISAAKTLIRFQTPQTRVPLAPLMTPRRQVLSDEAALERQLLSDWAEKAEKIRQRLERERQKL